MRTIQFSFFALAAVSFAAAAAFAQGPAKKEQPPPPKGYQIGDAVADFTLPLSDGKTFKLSEHKGEVVVLSWWGATCPFVKSYDKRMADIFLKYNGKKAAVVYIDSNINETLEQAKTTLTERKLPFPIAWDADRAIADKFGAATTPHVFVLDAAHKLAYAGGIDDDLDMEKKDRANWAVDAVEALLGGKSVSLASTKNIGCTVKRVK